MVKTPKYWQDKHFQPLVEVKTAHGNPVMIPKRFTNGWETAMQMYKSMTRNGLDFRDGLEKDLETNPLFYDLERVFFEIYEENH